MPQILLDEYDITDKIERADKIALLSIGLINNNGTQTRNVVTTVNVNKNSTITYKPGVTTLVANKPITQLNGSYNFNLTVYYKAKKKTIIY